MYTKCLIDDIAIEYVKNNINFKDMLNSLPWVIDTPDFNDLEKLTAKIESSLSKVSKEIISDIKKLS